MSRCEPFRDQLSAFIEGELRNEELSLFEAHVEDCQECGDLLETMRLVRDTTSIMGALEAPPHLADDLSSSPCRRWLGLLYQAIDREISESNLKRLLGHLEGCPSCQRVWADMTLIHQVSRAMEAPDGLLERCVNARRRSPKRPFLTSRAATAAAYFIAVLASMMIGNPTLLARNPAAVAITRVSDTVSSEVADVAADSRGELRVMLWRMWQWGSEKADTMRQAVAGLGEDNDSPPEQGDRS